MREKDISIIVPIEENSMVGAGVIYKKEKLISHTTLHHSESALKTAVTWQKRIFLSFVVFIIGGIFLWPLLTIMVFIAVLSAIYFLDMVFNLYLVIKNLHFPVEISFSKKELDQLNNKALPIYSILCPLYKEEAILPQFVESIKKIDWPKDKLDVILLLEENDQETILAAKKINLPAYFNAVVVPECQPKTKPKACNFGLSKAHGEYLVIYDAEDQPEPDQLKKAYLGFNKVSAETVCLQAKLNYYNPHQNLLTKLFTAEYSLWFDVILPGLQTMNTVIPLGGTSNHFKLKALLNIKGWDPFNVTEDCDLGVRLFKHGYKTAIIDSTTFEEANSDIKNWLRQRSRWIKGYLQTYFVHMRDPLNFLKKHGSHALIFQLIIGARISFMIINPILWLMTIAYFAFNSYFGSAIEALFPQQVFYLAAISALFGNFIYIYNYMIGCAKRNHWGLIKYVYFVPFYWLLASVAAAIAFYQLIAKPHYWEKTVHGLHLKDIPLPSQSDSRL